MGLPLPGSDGIDKGIRCGRVPEDIPVQAFPQGGAHIRIRPEVHVGDPHRNLSVLRPAVLDAPGTAPVDDFVEIPRRTFICRLARTAGRQRGSDRAGRHQRRRSGSRYALEKCPSFHTGRKVTKKNGDYSGRKVTAAPPPGARRSVRTSSRVTVREVIS